MSSKNLFLTLSFLASAACAGEIGGPDFQSGVDGGSGSGSGSGSGGEDIQVCDEAVAINFEQRKMTPDIMMVVDRSGSMNDSINGGNSKWNTIRPAINNLVSSKGNLVHFGLMMFPWNGECGGGQVRVNPILDNAGGISAALNSVNANGGTPTHQSLSRAKDYYDGNVINPDGRIILLATDGLPTCNSSIDQSVNVITALVQSDIKTYVLGFNSGDVNLNGLNQMANAGGTGQMYNASSPQELSNALDAILGEVTVPSCEFQLQQTPKNDVDINVTINSVEMVRDDPNGWKYDAVTKTIILLGDSCNSVKTGGANGIDVDLGCGGTTID